MTKNLSIERSKLIKILNIELSNRKKLDEDLIFGEKVFLCNNYLIPKLNLLIKIKKEKLKRYQLSNARALDSKFPKQYHSNLYRALLI